MSPQRWGLACQRPAGPRAVGRCAHPVAPKAELASNGRTPAALHASTARRPPSRTPALHPRAN
eukprot:7182236-Prymnesium_polylepis.1